MHRGDIAIITVNCHFIASAVHLTSNIYLDGADNGSCPAMNRGDIAIITVNRPFIFDASVQRACLPDKEWDLNPGTSLVVVGNGFIDYDTEATSQELQVTLLLSLATGLSTTTQKPMPKSCGW